MAVFDCRACAVEVVDVGVRRKDGGDRAVRILDHDVAFEREVLDDRAWRKRVEERAARSLAIPVHDRAVVVYPVAAAVERPPERREPVRLAGDEAASAAVDVVHEDEGRSNVAVVARGFRQLAELVVVQDYIRTAGLLSVVDVDVERGVDRAGVLHGVRSLQGRRVGDVVPDPTRERRAKPRHGADRDDRPGRIRLLRLFAVHEDAAETLCGDERPEVAFGICRGGEIRARGCADGGAPDVREIVAFREIRGVRKPRSVLRRHAVGETVEAVHERSERVLKVPCRPVRADKRAAAADAGARGGDRPERKAPLGRSVEIAREAGLHAACRIGVVVHGPRARRIDSVGIYNRSIVRDCSREARSPRLEHGRQNRAHRTTHDRAFAHRPRKAVEFASVRHLLAARRVADCRAVGDAVLDKRPGIQFARKAAAHARRIVEGASDAAVAERIAVFAGIRAANEAVDGFRARDDAVRERVAAVRRRDEAVCGRAADYRAAGKHAVRRAPGEDRGCRRHVRDDAVREPRVLRLSREACPLHRRVQDGAADEVVCADGTKHFGYEYVGLARRVFLVCDLPCFRFVELRVEKAALDGRAGRHGRAGDERCVGRRHRAREAADGFLYRRSAQRRDRRAVRERLRAERPADEASEVAIVAAHRAGERAVQELRVVSRHARSAAHGRKHFASTLREILVDAGPGPLQHLPFNIGLDRAVAENGVPRIPGKAAAAAVVGIPAISLRVRPLQLSGERTGERAACEYRIIGPSGQTAAIFLDSRNVACNRAVCRRYASAVSGYAAETVETVKAVARHARSAVRKRHAGPGVGRSEHFAKADKHADSPICRCCHAACEVAVFQRDGVRLAYLPDKNAVYGRRRSVITEFDISFKRDILDDRAVLDDIEQAE